jgi:hypothetical protein
MLTSTYPQLAVASNEAKTTYHFATLKNIGHRKHHICELGNTHVACIPDFDHRRRGRRIPKV